MSTPSHSRVQRPGNRGSIHDSGYAFSLLDNDHIGSGVHLAFYMMAKGGPYLPPQETKKPRRQATPPSNKLFNKCVPISKKTSYSKGSGNKFKSLTATAAHLNTSSKCSWTFIRLEQNAFQAEFCCEGQAIPVSLH